MLFLAREKNRVKIVPGAMLPGGDVLIAASIGKGCQYFQEKGASALRFSDGLFVFFHYKRLFQGRDRWSLEK